MTDKDVILSKLNEICLDLGCRVTDNSTEPSEERILAKDAVWMMRSAFAIMTMQSGFALLEAGFVGQKNLANIIVKNTADAAVGGLVYWMIGYGISFGDGNFFFGSNYLFGSFCDNSHLDGSRCTEYFFQFSFASTATTIISGAIAERTKLKAYILLSLLNEISYCPPVRWVWSRKAFLANLGFYDLAGVCVVHANGGVSALLAASMIGPRIHRWENPCKFTLASPVTALTGTLMLWWAWFSFNCGSTLGFSGHLWKLNGLIAINTLNGSVGGACYGILVSMIWNKGRVDIAWLINSILGGLVSVTGISSVTSSWECLAIGAIGAMIAIGSTAMLERIGIDDPVGAVPVHFFAAFWGTLAVGIFGKNDIYNTLRGHNGLLHGGGLHLLGVQVLGFTCITMWSLVTTFIFLIAIDQLIGLRMTEEDEQLGADYAEHGIETEDGLRCMVPEDKKSESKLARFVARELLGNIRDLPMVSVKSDGERQTESESIPSDGVEFFRKRKSIPLIMASPRNLQPPAETMLRRDSRPLLMIRSMLKRTTPIDRQLPISVSTVNSTLTTVASQPSTSLPNIPKN